MPITNATHVNDHTRIIGKLLENYPKEPSSSDGTLQKEIIENYKKGVEITFQHLPHFIVHMKDVSIIAIECEEVLCYLPMPGAGLYELGQSLQTISRLTLSEEEQHYLVDNLDLLNILRANKPNEDTYDQYEIRNILIAAMKISALHEQIEELVKESFRLMGNKQAKDGLHLWLSNLAMNQYPSGVKEKLAFLSEFADELRKSGELSTYIQVK